MNKQSFWDDLIIRYPQLKYLQQQFYDVCNIIIDSLDNDGTLFVGGNGGSYCDCEHLCGELLKGFQLKRKLPLDIREKIINVCQNKDEGKQIANSLQMGIRCIHLSLSNHSGFNSAFGNDVDFSLIYAQQLHVLGRCNDVVIGFSTSGNSENIRKLFIIAKAFDIKTVLFTGKNQCACDQYADVSIHVPEIETHLIQQLHLPLYHTLALILEQHYFKGVEKSK